MFDLDLSGNLYDKLKATGHQRIVSGYSGAEVYHFPGTRAYLKIAKLGGFSDLGREINVLKWLEGKLNVPKVMDYESDKVNEYLLTSEICGVPAHRCLSSGDLSVDSATQLFRTLAQALGTMHDIDIRKCPFDQRLDARFARAWKNIQNHLLSETDAEFALEHDGKSPQEVYFELMGRRPSEEGLVFIHGDPSMPNILVQDDEVMGFIDLDGGGIADRYTDIAIFFRSFRRNFDFDIELEQIFCEAYGLKLLDHDKLEFYTTLDDLF
ncbi:MAG: APH(3') family aminoglycoside O-phosphotransferase [Acidobacteriota bacterium]